MNVVIVGANRGIGLELCRQYSKDGHKIIVFNRSESTEFKELNNIQVISGFDLLDDNSYSKISNVLRGKKIDLLIHNAGVFQDNQLGDLDYFSIEFQLRVNSIAPLRFIQRSLPFFNTPAKIGIMTSLMGSMTDNNSGGHYGYRMSKAAVNAAGKSLAHDLKSKGIAVGLLHPGYVRTRMTGGNGLINPDESAEGLIKVLDQLNLENSGGFWNFRQEELPW